MKRRIVLTGLAGGAILLMLAAPLGATASAAGVSARPPVITAKPDNVMVNTDTTLVGRNFKPATKLRLAECSKKNWVVPSRPCDSANTVTVRTNAKGQFKTKFKVEACPSSAAVSGDLAERCYIGVPKPSGVDTVRLEAAAPIVVTFP